MMLQAKNLSALPGIRHAFFTREGGVSDGLYASLNGGIGSHHAPPQGARKRAPGGGAAGLYASLNGGIGSHDAPTKVAENRARMAAALAVKPEHLLALYQIHS